MCSSCSKKYICALLAVYNIVQFYFVTFCVLILVAFSEVDTLISYGYIIFCFNFCVIMLVNDVQICCLNYVIRNIALYLIFFCHLPSIKINLFYTCGTSGLLMNHVLIPKIGGVQKLKKLCASQERNRKLHFS